MKHLVFAICLFGISVSTLKAQSPVYDNPYRLDTLNKKRVYGAVGLQGGIGVGTATGLYFAWYSNYPQSSFHWIDDSYGWLQIDKYGHATTVYHVSQFCYNMNRWAGMSRNKSMLVGVGIAYGFLTAVEVMDGHSEAWGASLTDVGMNTLGAATFVAQEYLWEEQRIIWKYSFHAGDYSMYDETVQARANKLFSDHLYQQWLKDYNGQTYWLSVNPSSFMKGDTWLPKWLNVAVGYSAEGMLGANWNVWYDEQCFQDYEHIERYRQYLFSLDVDFTRIPIKSKFYRVMAPYLNIIKIPFPTIEFNELGQVKGHWAYF